MRGSLRNILGLGLVPTGHRSVSPVPAHLLALVPKPVGKNENIKSAGADPIKDTVPLIQQMVRRELWQGKKLAAALKGKSVEETVRNNWNFIFDHIQYVKDPAGVESVRSLRRLVHEGRGDCDCFVSGLSNLLLNQGITHKLRVAKYANGNGDGLLGTWQHIYIIVPNKGSYITLDPVVHKYNYEVPFTETKDFTMRLEYLDGFSGFAGKCSTNTDPVNTPRVVVVPKKQLDDAGLVKTDRVLAEARIPFTETVIDNEPAYIVDTPAGKTTLKQFTPALQKQNLIASLTSAAVTAKDAVVEEVKELSSEQKTVGGIILATVFGILIGKAFSGNKKSTRGLDGVKPRKTLDTLKI